MKKRIRGIDKDLEPKSTLSRYSFKLNHIIPPLIGLLGTGSMILISHMLSRGALPILRFTDINQLNFLLSMQLFILPLSFLALASIFFYDRQNFKRFFQKGDINAKSEAIKLIGFRKTGSWKTVGPTILILGILVTMTFTTIAVIQMKGVINGKVLVLLPFALIMALTNSWSEEIFNRFAIVAGLNGKVKPLAIYWISAIVFGIPHYWGTPGGILGVFLTGILSWFLAKSVFETRGLFWAWSIHFAMDVLIFMSQIMIISGLL